MRSENELLRELQRLNRTGVINDEEFLVLRKIIRGGQVSPEFYRRFDQLFAGKSKKFRVMTKPVMTKEEKPVVKSQEKPLEKNERLYSFEEAINELNLKLTPSGGFDYSRELLKCPACGMFEDISTDGRLITAESDYPEVDTGLRFTKISEKEWECPDCGQFFHEDQFINK